MRHERFIPMEYKNEQLINEFNQLMIDIKIHLFNLPVKRHKPTNKEIDEIFNRIMLELRKDAKPLVKY